MSVEIEEAKRLAENGPTPGQGNSGEAKTMRLFLDAGGVELVEPTAVVVIGGEEHPTDVRVRSKVTGAIEEIEKTWISLSAPQKLAWVGLLISFIFCIAVAGRIIEINRETNRVVAELESRRMQMGEEHKKKLEAIDLAFHDLSNPANSRYLRLLVENRASLLEKG